MRKFKEDIQLNKMANGLPLLRQLSDNLPTVSSVRSGSTTNQENFSFTNFASLQKNGEHAIDLIH